MRKLLLSARQGSTERAKVRPEAESVPFLEKSALVYLAEPSLLPPVVVVGVQNNF